LSGNLLAQVDALQLLTVPLLILVA